MNTVDDLRRVLEDQAGRAPDERGLIEDARAGAARIRRRRRVTTAAGAAAAVVVSALVVPFAVRHESAPPITPAPPPTPFVSATPSAPPTPAGPRQSDVAVGFAPGTGLTIVSYILGGNSQNFSVVRDDGVKFGLTVDNHARYVRDPIEGSDRISVGDRKGWHLARPAPRWMHKKPTTEHLLMWETKEGSGITLSTTSTGKAGLLAAARAIRPVRPAPPNGPLQLGWLPDGLITTTIQILDNNDTAAIRLSPPGGDPMLNIGIYLSVGTMDPGWVTRWTRGKPATHTIAGRQVWYEERPEGRTGVPEALLVFTAGDCGVNIQVTGPRPFADLQRLVEQATVGSCTTKDGWGPVVPK